MSSMCHKFMKIGSQPAAFLTRHYDDYSVTFGYPNNGYARMCAENMPPSEGRPEPGFWRIKEIRK